MPARAWILGLLMFVAIAAGAKAALPAVEPVIMRDNVAIPMRDGVNLRAMIALPAGGKGRWPIILTITPYQRDGGWAKAQKTHFADGGVFDQIFPRK
jgi:predicted acyl esterase